MTVVAGVDFDSLKHPRGDDWAGVAVDVLNPG
jgi:hypothetical protein